jgi:hypothetical protein
MGMRADFRRLILRVAFVILSYFGFWVLGDPGRVGAG